MRRIAILCLILLCTAPNPAAPKTPKMTFQLPSGATVVLNSVSRVYSTKEKESAFQARLELEGYYEQAEDRLARIADEFFLLYFGPYAEKGGVRIAAVNVGATKRQYLFKSYRSRAFRYDRGNDGVWQPFHNSELDDAPLPEAKPHTLKSGTVLHVEFTGPGYLPKYRRNGYGANYWADAPLSEPGRAYLVARDFWQELKWTIGPEYDIAVISGFDEPRRGFFHFRQYLYLTVARTEGGGWPDLPETLEKMQEARPGMVMVNFTPDALETVWPDGPEDLTTDWPEE